MLEELHVSDLALIEDAWLEFGPGMTVLTGETGAGKTALVGAIKLLVGERADSQMVRAGSAGTTVEGRIVVGEREHVAQRRVTADGRSRCQLDGQMATVGGLAETIGPLFDLHGQHEHQALLHPAEHVGYLDRFIGDPAYQALETYRAALADFIAARTALRDLDKRLAEDRERADYLRFVVDEIEAVGPEPGEDEGLEARLPALRHGEKLSAASREAYTALRGDGGAGDSLARAQAALARVAGLDPALDRLADALGAATAAIDDLGPTVRAYGEGIEYDPQLLNEVEARLAALAALKKKYGPDLASVLRTRDDSAARLESVDDGELARATAQARVETTEQTLRSAGDALASVRVAAEKPFLAALVRQTADLAMEGTRFGVAFEELPFDEWTADGPHAVEFMCSAGPDQPLRPLAKIASGGEVSRVMLALKSALGAADRVPVLVFDEVDSGIGGATATAVGRKLADLSKRHQVLVVTHLAQVAVFADSHIVVRKQSDTDAVKTLVETVSAESRVGEIARMLSGEDTPASRAHAEELLGNARDKGSIGA